jgi:hypothetical protein
MGQTEILGSGSGTVDPAQAGESIQVLIGDTQNPAQFKDISAYEHVTTYVTIVSGASGVSLAAFTASSDTTFFIAASAPDSNGVIIQTLDPAPPNLALQLLNGDPNAASTFKWMLVGRTT